MRKRYAAISLMIGALTACTYIKIGTTVVQSGDNADPTGPTSFGCTELANTLEVIVTQGLHEGGKAIVGEPFFLRVIARDAASSEVPTICRGLPVEASGTEGVCAPTGAPTYTSIAVQPIAPGQCSIVVAYQRRRASVNVEVIPGA